VAQLASGEPHAVLTITTGRGDFVLDNRTDAILPWAESRLRWIARQDRDLTDWAGFAPQNRPLLVASR
jgi:predicted transglutaminase-like cysteine proteinase